LAAENLSLLLTLLLKTQHSVWHHFANAPENRKQTAFTGRAAKENSLCNRAEKS
jgi:hypothetical protein